jgi:hypothetical protein
MLVSIEGTGQEGAGNYEALIATLGLLQEGRAAAPARDAVPAAGPQGEGPGPGLLVRAGFRCRGLPFRVIISEHASVRPQVEGLLGSKA